MSSFDHCKELGERGIREIMPLIESLYDFEKIEVVPPDIELQFQDGDVVVILQGGGRVTIEAKTEEDWTSRLYLEEHSNLSTGNRGWMHKSKAKLLFYYFLDRKLVYVIDLERLQRWAIDDDDTMEEPKGNRTRLPLKKQGTHDQLNDTWGYCVPIDVIRKEVGIIKEFNLKDGIRDVTPEAIEEWWQK